MSPSRDRCLLLGPRGPPPHNDHARFSVAYARPNVSLRALRAAFAACTPRRAAHIAGRRTEEPGRVGVRLISQASRHTAELRLRLGAPRQTLLERRMRARGLVLVLVLILMSGGTLQPPVTSD